MAVEMKHSPQIREFIYRFDRGYYPKLFPTYRVFRKLTHYCLALGMAGSALQRVPG